MPGLPYDGWYNGNPKLMIANGTYADFRPMLEEKVRLKKLTPAQLETADREWNAIPLEERQARRAVVVQDSTPVETEVITNKGKIKVLRAVPSDNNNLSPDRNRRKGVRKTKVPVGTLTSENNPLNKSTPQK